MITTVATGDAAAILKSRLRGAAILKSSPRGAAILDSSWIGGMMLLFVVTAAVGTALMEQRQVMQCFNETAAQPW